MTETRLESIPYERCLDLLREGSVGRVAIVVDTFPILLPVNYRLVETSSATWIVIRTRPGNVIDRASTHVAFEIDGVDLVHEEGWSVFVRGMLHHVDADAADFRNRFDPKPWLDERDAWLVIEPFSVTGRHLQAATPEWAFHARAYL